MSDNLGGLGDASEDDAPPLPRGRQRSGGSPPPSPRAANATAQNPNIQPPPTYPPPPLPQAQGGPGVAPLPNIPPPPTYAPPPLPPNPGQPAPGQGGAPQNAAPLPNIPPPPTYAPPPLPLNPGQPAPAQGGAPQNAAPLPNIPPAPTYAPPPLPPNAGQPAPAQGGAPQNAAPGQQVGQQRPVNDSPQQERKRRWTVWAQRTFGLPNIKGQNGILASSVATFARIDETTLQPGGAAALTASGVGGNDADFAAFVTALDAYEKLPLPRERPSAQALLAAATRARTSAANNPAKLKPIDETLAALKGFELRDRIIGAGNPPWTGRQGADAAAAKVELDMLSVQGTQPQMRAQGGGVNPSFWLERSGNDGAGPQKSFLCKPASAQNLPAPVVMGIPNGGEVAREALTGRAAAILGRTMQFDLDMPETHAVPVPESFFPAAPASAANGQVTCSVQEAKSNSGDLLEKNGEDYAKIPAAQCAAAVMLDLVTLNTDRHAGNLLLGPDNGLLPIDHGCSFPNADQPGKARIADTMGGPHNALLRLPGSHKPMTEEMAKGVRSLDPTAIKNELAAEHAEVGARHPEMSALVTDASLSMTVYSGRFLKLSGGVKSGKLRLSPAAVQVAFGANSAELLGFPCPTDDKVAKAFDKRAREILKQALKEQPLTELVTTLEDATWAKLRKKLKALRWEADKRNASPNGGITNDPALCAIIVGGNLRKPNGLGDDPAVVRAWVTAQKVKPAAVTAAMVDLEMDTLSGMAGLLPPQGRAAPTTLLQRNDAALRADPAARKAMTREMQKLVAASQRAEYEAIEALYDFAQGYRNDGWLLEALRSRDLDDAERQLVNIRQDVAQGNLPRKNAAAAPQAQNAQSQGGANG